MSYFLKIILTFRLRLLTVAEMLGGEENQSIIEQYRCVRFQSLILQPNTNQYNTQPFFLGIVERNVI